MPIINRTREWLNSLENYVVVGTPLAPNTPETRRYDEEHNEGNAPERPTRQEWNPDGTGDRGALGNFRRLFHMLQLFAAGESDATYARSLLLAAQRVGIQRYVLVERNLEIRGNLYMLDAVPSASPFTNDLRRFVAFVPARYSRNGDDGHYAWLHFTPVWGEDRQRSSRFGAAHRDYPDSIWQHKYIADYLCGNRLLASFSASGVNAVFFLPVHRFTVGSALEPLGNLQQLIEILRQLFIMLEVVEPRLRGRNRTRFGFVNGIGVSCFSFGAQYCSRLFQRTRRNQVDFDKLRAGAFLDGVTGDAAAACRWMIAPTSGWVRSLIPASNDTPKRLILFQQSNRAGYDFVGPFAQVSNRASLRRGETLDVLGAPPSWRNVVRFHRVHPEEMMRAAGEQSSRSTRSPYSDWHPRIQYLFAEGAYSFCRDCFLY